MSKQINAFHKDYVSTHMPEFLSKIRSESIAKANGEKYGAIGRANRGISLEPTTFHVYSKAGVK